MSFGDYHGTPRRLVGHFRPSYNLKRNLSLIYQLPNSKVEIRIETQTNRIQELSRLFLEPLFDANRRRLNRCSRQTRPPRLVFCISIPRLDGRLTLNSISLPFTLP